MYSEGKSKEEAYDIIGKKNIARNRMYQNPNSPSIENFGLANNVRPLQTHMNIQIWCGRLIYNSRKLDTEIDEIFNIVIELNDGFYSSKSKLKNQLKNIFDLKSSLRALEKDVEEFANTISITDHKLDSNICNNVYQAMNQANQTYMKTYELIIFKLKNISNTRVTFTNIIISLVALVVSFLALTQ